jgi:transcription elongation GreA/GreB family factor
VRLWNDEEDLETDLFLVFPADARGSDVLKPKLSIFTETGLSMLGRRVGDKIDDRLQIVDLPYQPEATGDFDL